MSFERIIDALTFIDKPECTLKHSYLDNSVVLTCMAKANPAEIFFEWRKDDNVTLVEGMEDLEDRSILTLEPDEANLGAYFCYVSNAIGESIPCVMDVQGIIASVTDPCTHQLFHESVFSVLI